MSTERSTKLALEAEVRQLRQRIAALERGWQQEFLASLLAHAPYGIAVLRGRDLRYELVNPTFQAMVEPETELIGRRYGEVFSEATAAGAEARLLKVIETGEPWILGGSQAPIPGRPDARWAGQVVPLPAAEDGEPCLLALVWDVTRQVAANEAQREAEARFGALVTATSDVVFRVNANSTILLSLDGRGLVDDTDKPTTNWLEKYVYRDDLPRVKAAIEEALRTKDNFELEHRTLHADGAVGWAHTRAIPIQNADGEVFEWFGAASDITERKQAEERSSQHNKINAAVNRIISKALLDIDEKELGRQCLAVIEEATESKFGFIRGIDAAGQFGNIAISDGGCETCRITDATGQGRPALRDGICGTFERVLLDGKGFFANDPASHPDGICTPDGHPSLKAFLGMPMEHDGKTIGVVAVGNREGGYRQQDLECLEALSGATVQVLIRLRAERALRASEERERARAADMAAILETAPVAMLISRDRKCSVVVGNSTAYELLRLPAGTNFSSAAPEGQGQAHFTVIRDGRQMPIRDLPIRVAASTGQPVREYEFEIAFPDGERRTLVGDAVPLLRLDGKPRGAVAAFLDITERKRMEKEVERQNQAKDKFLAMLGHELRNPLAAMNSAVGLLAGASSRERSSLEELMGRQIQVLRRLVDDLLEISRIEQGRIALQKEAVDLLDLLKAAAMVAQSAISGRKQKLVIRLPSEPVLFLADRVRLEQVVANLLDNASKYTKQRGRIELSGSSEGAEIVIRCKDNGHGIPPEIQASIFEPFTRGVQNGESSQAGLGIGLSLVKRLVELHGGTIAVESGGLGTGSEFTVRLPWVKAPAAARHAGPKETAPRSQRSLSIAIVEDNPDVARTRAMGLEQAGHKVVLFANAASALARIPRLKPDAMLIDIGLPDMDGYELAAKLREKPELRRALFVAISGFKRRPQTGKSSDAFDDYLVKPVGLSEILAALDGHGQSGKSGSKASVEAREAPPKRKSLRVLLVEDHAELAELTAKMLRGEGLEVRVANSGQQALDAASKFRPQLILCDLHLPDVSGRDVIRALRTSPATQKAYAVILTAMSQTEVHAYNRSAKAHGVDEYVAKPLTIEAVRDLLPRVKEPRSGTPK